jgi:hypothetical protein
MNTCYDLNMRHDVEAFLSPLERLPGLDISARFELGETAWFDAIVEVRSQTGVDRYAAETMLGVTTTTLPSVRSRLEHARAQSGMPPLLLTDYVTPAVADGLLDHGMAFADLAGNVHLDGAAGYVLVLGRRRTRQTPKTGFTALELELIFALLAEPTLFEAPVRQVSERTGISIGTISALLNELVEQGHLGQRKAAGRRRLLVLQEPKRLLARWEFGYLETVRPRLSPSTWQLPPHTPIERIVQEAESLDRVLIGGEHAADAITGFLKPSTLTLHVPPGAQKRAAVQMRLVPTQGSSDVVLVDRFQTSVDALPAQAAPGPAPRRPYVHPILVRAELLATGSDRLREVADRLLDPILKPLGSDAP